MPALTADNVRALLPHADIPQTQVDLVIDMVHAWLKTATGDAALAYDYPDGLWASAVELAGLLVDNPTSKSQKTVGPTSASWPLAARRDAILAGVRDSYRRARMAPIGNFPSVPVWPDPWSVRR